VDSGPGKGQHSSEPQPPAWSPGHLKGKLRATERRREAVLDCNLPPFQPESDSPRDTWLPIQHHGPLREAEPPS
jgi:hypothetical protein